MSTERRPPAWLAELERFLPLRTQFYLYGNVYDRHLPAPAVGRPETGPLPLMDLLPLLRMFLRSNGFPRVFYYDMIDGFDLVEWPDEGDPRKPTVESLLHELGGDAGPEVADLVEKQRSSSRWTVDDALVLFPALLARASRQGRPTATVLQFASRLSTNPAHLERDEARRFTRLLKSAQQAAPGSAVMVCLCDKLSDIPAWLLRDNPLTHGIEIPRPDVEARRWVFDARTRSGLHFASDDARREVVALLADQTEGFATRECDGVVEWCRRRAEAGRDFDLDAARRCLELYKYGVQDNPWSRLTRERVRGIERTLRERIKGQDHAIDKVMSVVQRATLGLHDLGRHGNRPKGVLFFAGPTGTGKTEVAKTLARAIFNRDLDQALVRFDMSEYQQDHSDERLTGAPPGYVGYDEGGQLTSAVRARPFSILLFDEMDKANPKIFDKFLQIIDDGRLTDGRGQTTYFGETLIIFTSNIGFKKTTSAPAALETSEVMRSRVLDEIRSFFIDELRRPEMFNRFGENFVVFDHVRDEPAREILRGMLADMADVLRAQRRFELSFDAGFDDHFFDALVRDNLANGGRGIRNRVEEHIENGLSRYLYESDGPVEGRRVRVSVSGRSDPTCPPRVTFTNQR